MAREIKTCGMANAALLMRPDRHAGVFQPIAGFDLEKGQNMATAGDDVDFADRAAPVARHNAPAREAQKYPSNGFGGPAVMPSASP